MDYKVESNSNGSNDLRVQSLEGSKNVKIQLYDLNNGQVASQKEVNINGSFKTIFTNVKSSLYLLYIWLPGCNKPVVVGDDKQGILIEN
jgi:phosphoribosylformylglycinamidine (FGAM) synthase-like amidotransferase family enzyme